MGSERGTVEQLRQAALFHLLNKGMMVEVLDGLHPGLAGGFDIFKLVVEEEDVSQRGFKALGGGMIDGGLGLGYAKAVRPSMVVKAVEPVELVEQAVSHGIADIRENASAYARALEALCPVEHRRIEASPKIDVGNDEVLYLLGSEDGSGAGGNLLPVGEAAEVAAVVGVAELPIATMQGLLGEARDLAHALPYCGIGRSRENHAVVEDNCLDRFHA